MHLVSVYEKANPGVKVSVLQVNNDNSLQKVLTAVRGGTLPDIAYLYGSWAPNVAKIPQVVNLTSVVAKPSVHWSDFWVSERDVATVNGKVIGIPALVDNLAVVYNKTLFAQAGLKPPASNWTWAQFQADAKALTSPAKKQYGTAYVTPGSEDTVWHCAALPGVNTFVANLGNVKQARPQLATYPQISQALGQMVVSVLLGKSEPKAALDAAAAKVNAILAGSGG